MNKLKYFLILIVCTIYMDAANAQKKIKEKKVIEVQGIMTFKGNSKPVTGQVISRHENGMIKSETTYKDGRKSGDETFYGADGYSTFRATYKDGKLEGRVTKYLENGGTEAQFYKNGQKDSLFVKWDKNNQVVEFGYYKNGKKNGVYEYRINGVIKSQVHFKDGKLDGRVTEFLENGGEEAQFYKNGQKDSLFVKWNKNNQVVATGYYKNGKKNGEFTTYDTIGNILENIIFTNDIPGKTSVKDLEWNSDTNDLMRCYYVLSENEKVPYTGMIIKYWDTYKGTVKSEETYVNGFKNGIVREYMNDGWNKVPEDTYGTLEAEYYYKNGKLEGSYTKYHSDLFEESVSFYKDGLLDGLAYEYDNEGKLMSECNYKKGKLHGIKTEYRDYGTTRDNRGISMYYKSFEGEYIDGEPHGRHRIWWRENALQGEWNYDNGRPQTYRLWEVNGQKTEEKYLNADKSYVVKKWYRNGQLRYTGEFDKDGKQHGYHRTWREDGTKRNSNFYINGSRQFHKEINYDRNGNIKR